MGWFSRKKQTAPLVPGRDRASVSAKTRPAYSYYAGRTASTGSGHGSSQRAAAASRAEPVRRSHLLSVYNIVLAACTVVVVLCVVKLLAVSPQGKVVVTAADGYPVSQLAVDAYTKAADTMLRSSVLNRGKLTLNTNGIARNLQKQFPELTSVVVTVPLVGNHPVIYVSPSKPSFTLQTASGFYSMDAKGYILAKLSAPIHGFTLLKEGSNRPIRPGSQYLASSTVAFSSTVLYELRQGGIAVSYLDLPTTAPYELDAYIQAKPYYIKFNLEGDALEESGAAVATLQQLGANTPGHYLDVRVAERAYYK